jgi:hypothetical protein
MSAPGERDNKSWGKLGTAPHKSHHRPPGGRARLTDANKDKPNIDRDLDRIPLLSHQGIDRRTKTADPLDFRADDAHVRDPARGLATLPTRRRSSRTRSARHYL